MKKILFVHSSSELYGSDRSLLNIVREIDKRQYQVHVILPCDGPLVEEMKKFPNITVVIFEVAVLRRQNLSVKGGFEYMRDFCASFRFIKKYIKQHGIDLVDTNTAVVFPGAIAAKLSGKKSVWHIREIISSSMENKVISLVMNRFADVIIANSKATGKVLLVNQDKVRVVYNAVAEKKDAALAKHDGLIVGMAGRINRWKGQKLLVDAAEIVHKELPEVKFWIAGDVYTGEDHLKEELIQHIKEKHLEDTVILLGQVNDMPSFYRGIDLFVLPSTQPEPFGLVVIEAMEYGLPVVATNHGGPVEIVSEGVDGYLVDHQAPEQMADRIVELMSDPDKRREMGQRGQKKKRERFSVAAMVDGIVHVFEEVMAR